ncbi:hypothetical protein CI610_03319 [invertebrate metagenome]|uniref:Uncharacterized protein n=1 Tax=invertebrate metagenome TaxID=1711999 RepID=A0A2H9T3J2_9ZZZZ
MLDKPITSVCADFKENHPNVSVSMSTFKRNKPNNIESTRKQHWEGCLCDLCTNIDLKLKALNQLATKKGSEIKMKDKYECLGITLCQKSGRYHQQECIMRKYLDCSVDNIVAHYQPLATQCIEEEVTYTKWERVKKNC